MKAALYARYSTDNQRRTSIDDQLRNGRAKAALEQLSVDEANVYADDEVSGSMPIESRPGSARLMRAAAAGGFEVLIIEALDRFSRNLVDQERMMRRLEHRGVRIIGCVDGYDSRLEGREFMRQVRGSFNEQLLRDIGKKTHRGLGGQVERGFHAGGISYGYTSQVAGLDGKGEPIGHRLSIDAAEAEHVRWIYARYAEGWSCQKIAADLNRRKVPSPRASTWAVSALYGSPAKGAGVLNNELYIGNYIWNRSKWTKDPDTGKRQRADRPREEWKIAKRPELAIVGGDLWREVRSRMDRPGIAGGQRGKGARPRTLFGGLVACGNCGAAVIAVNENAYGCSARQHRGVHVCKGVRVPRRQLEARLLSLVRDELLSPEALATLQATVTKVITAAKKGREQLEGRTRTRLAELEREIANVVDALASCGPSEALKARLQAAEAERAALKSAKESTPAHGAIPALVAAYKRMVANLQGALERDVPRARELLRAAVGPIKLFLEKDGAVYAEMETGAGRLLMAAGGSDMGLVAGTCTVSRKRIRVR